MLCLCFPEKRRVMTLRRNARTFLHLKLSTWGSFALETFLENHWDRLEHHKWGEGNNSDFKKWETQVLFHKNFPLMSPLLACFLRDKEKDFHNLWMLTWKIKHGLVSFLDKWSAQEIITSENNTLVSLTTLHWEMFIYLFDNFLKKFIVKYLCQPQEITDTLRNVSCETDLYRPRHI